MRAATYALIASMLHSAFAAPPVRADVSVLMDSAEPENAPSGPRSMIEVGSDHRQRRMLFDFSNPTAGVGAAAARPGALAPTGATDRLTLQWSAAWSTIRPIEYVATGAATAAAIAGEAMIHPPEIPNWRGGILLDDTIRTMLRLESASARNTAAVVSNALLYGLIAYPVVVDAGIFALGVEHSPQVAWQMVMIDAESYAVTAAALAFTKNLVGRQRPYGRECDGPNPDPGCASADENRSFFSGHTAFAFTSAGLTCTHHGHLPLFGGGAADAAACFAALAAAAATGALRIMADQHYASDVLTGAAVGTFSGFILPSLLHYGFGDSDQIHDDASQLHVTLVPVVGPNYAGASASGVF